MEISRISGTTKPLRVREISISVGTPLGSPLGGLHTCVLLESGSVRCWGNADEFSLLYGGRLGYGNSEDIGDDETPASAGDVDVGAPVVSLVAGETHTCALLVGGAVRCWGSGPLGYGNDEGGAIRCWGRANYGQLGYANIVMIGDDETPASDGDVMVD
jgi:hypothetical protein